MTPKIVLLNFIILQNNIINHACLCFAGNGRVIFDFKCKNVTGDPDGMTIDTNGNLWVACYNSDHVRFQKNNF